MTTTDCLHDDTIFLMCAISVLLQLHTILTSKNITDFGHPKIHVLYKTHFPQAGFDVYMFTAFHSNFS